MIKRKFVFGLVFMALGIYSHEAFSLKKILPAPKEAYPSTFVVTGSSAYYCPNATASAITAKSTNTTCGVGTGTAYVSVTVNWYQNTSASQIGAVLVSTINTLASTVTYQYTPSTASNGTLYYYAIISWSAGTICAPAGSITTDYFSVTVSPPTLSSVSQASSVCGGSSATINLTGLRPSSSQSVSYNINGGSTASRAVTSSSSGTGSFQTFVQSSNDGNPLTVTKIAVNGCSSNFNSNNSTILSVNASPSFSKSPSGASKNYCLNSTATALSVTASAGSGTISSYQWYSNEAQAITGGTLVATHISALTTDTYTPITTSLGTLYYYCIVTNSGNCSKTSSISGAITVNGNNTSTLTSTAGTDAQTVCNNTAIASITYATTGATGANFSGLPSGVSGSWSANVATISGTPTASGVFSYTVTLTGGCGVVTSDGTITVNSNDTSILSSAAGTDDQTVCINTAITNITYATTGATGANFSGLPTGVTGNWSANVATISGTPTVNGLFNYTVTLTGGTGCGGVVTSNGSITVNPSNTSTLTSAAGTDAQTACVNTAITNITYATTAATGANFSGLPSGVTGNWAANVATISGTPTTTGTFNYTVTLTGGCGLVTSNGSIIVNPTNTSTLTSAAGTDAQFVCFNASIVNITYATTGATGANFSGLPAGVTGNWLANVATISGSPTASGTFNYTVTLTGGCGAVTSNGSINVSPSSYTKWTGNVSTDWSNASNWTCGLPSNTIDADIPSGLINYPAIGAVTVSTRNLTIATGSSLQLNSASTLQVSGDLNCNGVFTSGGGTVEFNGASLQNLGASGNSVITFDNINVTNTTSPISVSVESNQNLKGVLTLSANSTFDADGSTGASVFTLLSTSDLPTVDASIATLPAGASVSGKVTVQRFMGRSGSTTAYQVFRDISSPVNSTVSDLQNSLPVTGPFTNSSVVTTDGSTVDNTVDYSISSLEIYDETVSGPRDNGWTDFPVSGGNTATASFVAGKGYSLFVYGSDYPVLQNGNAKWSLTGTINSGSISLPVTLTKTGVGGTYNSGTDGWNFVGNPYPSTIDWDATTGWTKTKINNAIYIDDFSSGIGVYASYVNGVSTNGGSRYIAMGQGFWVKGNAVSPALSVDERVKVGGQQTSFFRESSPSNLLRIALSSDQVRDETVIYFTESATSEFDSNLDALKMMNQNGSFNLSSLLANGDERYSINALPLTDCNKKVSLDVRDVASGSYSLNFSDFESLPTSTTISLKDNFENRLVDVRENQKYAFEVNQINSSTYGHERFSLIFNFGAGTAQKCDVSAGSGLSVYPNPSKGIVTIEVNGEDLASGQLFNSMGMIISSVGFTNEGQVQIAKHDFSKEGSGVYFLRVMQGGRVNTIRIVRD